MIKPRVIKSEEDYQAALAHLESLMDAVPGSPEEEDLEVLAVLIETYEKEHFPIGLPDPIEAIKFRMEQQGLTRKDLVPYIGSQSKVSEVLNKKRPLSLAMMRALHKGLGIPAEVLMQEPGGQLDPAKYEINDRLFAEMFRAGYFSFFAGSLNLAKEKMEEILLQFFGPYQNQQAQRVYCRQSPKARLDSTPCVAETPANYDTGASEEPAAGKKQVDDKALEAWHIRALTLAGQQEKTLPDYAHEEITREFMRDVIKLSTFDNGPLLAQQKLADYGIPLIILPHLVHTYLDGACFLTSSGRAVIGLTLRHDRLDNFWFTLAHELAHVYLHLHPDSNRAFFDDTESGAEASESRCEAEANQLTWELLIPEAMWAQKIQPHISRLTRDQIVDFSKSIFVSPAIVAGRVRWHTGDFNHFSDLVGHGKVAHLFVKTKENHESVA